jgi:hypothetical protein
VLEEHESKIKSNAKLIKGFMLLVVFVQVVQFYQTQVLDFGAIAGSIGVLALLRGFLLSPSLFASPSKARFGSGRRLNSDSYKYFALALVLIIVSAF